MSLIKCTIIHLLYFFYRLVCFDDLGMENYGIPDGNIKASSTMYPESPSNQPFQARLNGESCWQALKGEVTPWIQADIGYQTFVSGVVTQGDGGVGDNLHWVTSFNVSTFAMSVSDKEIFIEDEDGIPMVNTKIKRNKPKPKIRNKKQNKTNKKTKNKAKTERERETDRQTNRQTETDRQRICEVDANFVAEAGGLCGMWGCVCV